MKYENQIHENLREHLEDEGKFWKFIEDGCSATPARTVCGTSSIFSNPEGQKWVKADFERMIFTYIEADIRAVLYRELPTAKFPRDLAIFGTRPLRPDENGELINPITIHPGSSGSSYTKINPPWAKGKKEWGFFLHHGVIIGPRFLRNLELGTKSWGDTKSHVQWTFSMRLAWTVRPELGMKFLFDVE